MVMVMVTMILAWNENIKQFEPKSTDLVSYDDEVAYFFDLVIVVIKNCIIITDNPSWSPCIESFLCSLS